MSNNLNENKPQLLWMPVTDLKIDDTYQRDTNSRSSQKNLDYLTKNFSWSRFGALVVVRTKGCFSHFVVDGQHRLRAAIANGIEAVPCAVIKSDFYEEQAKAFVGINVNRVNLTKLAKYHAMIVAGDEDACSLKEICAEADIDIPKAPIVKGHTAPRQTQAIGTLLKLLGTNSRRQIIWALTIIPEAYPDEVGHMRASLIKVMAKIAKDYPEINRDRMVDTLMDVDPIDLERSARDYIAIHGGTAVDAICQALIRIYNKKSPAKERLI